MRSAARPETYGRLVNVLHDGRRDSRVWVQLALDQGIHTLTSQGSALRISNWHVRSVASTLAISTASSPGSTMSLGWLRRCGSIMFR